MTDYAPGPWLLGHTVSGEPCVTSADPGADNGGFMVATTFGPCANANARLVAAAPDMRAALVRFLDLAHADPSPEMQAACAAACAALDIASFATVAADLDEREILDTARATGD